MAAEKWSEFSNVGALLSGDILVGLRSGANVRFSAPSVSAGTGLTGGGYGNVTLSLAAIAQNHFLGTTTNPTGVPSALPFSTFLQPANNLSDLADVPTAVSNLGLTIGVNTQAYAGAALTLAGAFSTIGAFTIALTATGNSALTLPTSGTLATTSQIPSVTPAALTKTDDTNVTLTLGGTPNTALLQATSLTLGWSGLLSPARGGTGVNNGTSTLTMGGSIDFIGAFTVALTATANSTLTLPTSGTLATTANLVWTKGGGTGSGIGGDGTSTSAGAYSLVYGTSSQTSPADHSFVFGDANSSGNAANSYSFVFGDGNGLTTAFANNVFMFGSGNSGTAAYSLIFGNNNNNAATSGSYCFTFGNNASNAFSGSVVWGDSNSSPNASSAANQWNTTFAGGYRLFVGATDALSISSSSVVSLANALTVPNGGTGNTSATAYAVLCGGTTTTGALQSVASLGTSGYVLTSTGGSSLPTFQASSVAVGGITGLGTGVATALADNVGTAGSFVVNGGAGGTPSSITLTNGTGYTVANLADVAWTDFSGSIGFTGFSANPTSIVAQYKIIGKTCFVMISMSAGTSNATSFTVTGLPATSSSSISNFWTPIFLGTNNSLAATGISGVIASSSTTMSMLINQNGGGWTAAGTKGFLGSFFYAIT